MDEKVTIEEFLKMTHEQRLEAYPKMSDHDKFLWRTQYETMNGTVVGHRELTPEEKERGDKHIDEWLKRLGVIE